jgi:hypothetical protein
MQRAKAHGLVLLSHLVPPAAIEGSTSTCGIVTAAVHQPAPGEVWRVPDVTAVSGATAGMMSRFR